MKNLRLFGFILTFILVIQCILFPVKTNAATVKLSKKSITLTVGEIIQLKLLNAKGKTIWISSDDNIVTVNKNGKIKALKNGTAIIYATNNKNTYNCKINISKPKISSKDAFLTIGEEYKLNISNTSAKVIWKTDNNEVATVDKNGLIKGIGSGETYVTAIIEKEILKCKILIFSPRFDYSEINLSPGEAFNNFLLYHGEDTTWESSDKDTVIVNSQGEITALKEGVATIKAITYGKEYTYKVNVVISQYLIARDLNKKFKSINTPMGNLDLEHNVTVNTSDLYTYDISVQTNWSGDFTPFYDPIHSIKYTEEQKEETINILRQVQSDIYDYLVKYYPNKKLEGGYYWGYYEYPHIRVGYKSVKFMSWNNYNYDFGSTYNDTTIDYFKWFNIYDDYYK